MNFGSDASRSYVNSLSAIAIAVVMTLGALS
jgi:hypothetical protein